MATKKEIAKSLGMKYTTYLRRVEKNIPMDRPFINKPGGNYKINEATAKKIWHELQNVSHFTTIQHIADKYGVPKSVVSKIKSSAFPDEKPKNGRIKSEKTIASGFELMKAIEAGCEFIELNAYGWAYKIEAKKALEILNEVKNRDKRLTKSAIASMYGVPVSIVNNIASGRCWNEITGLPKKVYEEDLS